MLQVLHYWTSSRASGIVKKYSHLSQRFKWKVQTVFSLLNIQHWQFHAMEIKILELVQKNFALMGINPHRPVNPNIFFVSTAIIWSHFSNCMFLFHVASTFQEYTLSINSTSTTTLFILVYTIFVWKEQELLEFIKCLELILLRNRMYSLHYDHEFSKVNNHLLYFPTITGSKMLSSKRLN